MFNIGSQMGDDDDVHEVSLIDTFVQEHVDTILSKDPLEVCLTAEEATFLDSPEVGSLMEMLALRMYVALFGTQFWNRWAPHYLKLSHHRSSHRSLS